MKDSEVNHRAARIIGASMIVGVAAIATGLQLANPWREPSVRNKCIETSFAQWNVAVKPQLKPVPRDRFPLTLGNEPADCRSGVINADHIRVNFLDSEKPRITDPFMAESYPPASR